MTEQHPFKWRHFLAEIILLDFLQHNPVWSLGITPRAGYPFALTDLQADFTPTNNAAGRVKETDPLMFSM
jgi:hypothetical protein